LSTKRGGPDAGVSPWRIWRRLVFAGASAEGFVAGVDDGSGLTLPPRNNRCLNVIPPAGAHLENCPSCRALPDIRTRHSPPLALVQTLPAPVKSIRRVRNVRWDKGLFGFPSTARFCGRTQSRVGQQMWLPCSGPHCRAEKLTSPAIRGLEGMEREARPPALVVAGSTSPAKRISWVHIRCAHV